jgi:hypothetical protein
VFEHHETARKLRIKVSTLRRKQTSCKCISFDVVDIEPASAQGCGSNLYRRQIPARRESMVAICNEQGLSAQRMLNGADFARIRHALNPMQTSVPIKGFRPTGSRPLHKRAQRIAVIAPKPHGAGLDASHRERRSARSNILWQRFLVRINRRFSAIDQPDNSFSRTFLAVSAEVLAINEQCGFIFAFNRLPIESRLWLFARDEKTHHGIPVTQRRKGEQNGHSEEAVRIAGVAL